jgi:hypothetical protein
VNAFGRFLRRLGINVVVFAVFLAILWPLAGFGWAWEQRSLSFVGGSIATASILFALFSGKEGPPPPVRPGWRRLGRFLVEFVRAALVLGLCAAWAFSLFVWKFGLDKVMAVDANRELIAGAVGCALLSVWYGLDRAYVPGVVVDAD